MSTPKVHSAVESFFLCHYDNSFLPSLASHTQSFSTDRHRRPEPSLPLRRTGPPRQSKGVSEPIWQTTVTAAAKNTSSCSWLLIMKLWWKISQPDYKLNQHDSLVLNGGRGVVMKPPWVQRCHLTVTSTQARCSNKK